MLPDRNYILRAIRRKTHYLKGKGRFIPQQVIVIASDALLRKIRMNR